MNFAEKIVSLRKKSGLSQEELAQKLNVSRQAVSRWETGTAQPDAQNILQLSKLFSVSADYLLNDDYESDGDIPAVRSANQETQALFSKEKRRHLIAAVCFTVSAFCAVMGAASSANDTQLALSLFMAALCAGNAAAQFFLFARKR